MSLAGGGTHWLGDIDAKDEELGVEGQPESDGGEGVGAEERPPG